MRWWTGRGSRATPSASSASHTLFRIAHFHARGPGPASAPAAADAIPARAAASRRRRSASKAAASNEADDEELLLAADATATVARPGAADAEYSDSGGAWNKSGMTGFCSRHTTSVREQLGLESFSSSCETVMWDHGAAVRLGGLGSSSEAVMWVQRGWDAQQVDAENNHNGE
uniref:Uncharacterized protein n=1 Tax=Arundo donax TaxID=35708 RepID=A0A0A9CQU6_ARUDO